MICLPPKSSKSQNSCEGFKFSPSNSESYILPRKTFAHASILSHRILWDWQPYVLGQTLVMFKGYSGNSRGKEGSNTCYGKFGLELL